MTGTVNFSNYDSVELILEFVENVPECNLNTFVVNYNIWSIGTGSVDNVASMPEFLT
jgi:hypothetical protein